MPTVSPSAWGPKPIFILSTGLPAVGYKLFAYLAGSVGTKQNTYSDSTGTTTNPNPVILDVNGTPPDEWWWASGLSYKIVYAPAGDTDPPGSPIWSIDNVRGIGDATITPSEWVVSSLAPTFLSTTTFSLVGDQRATFQVGRRVRTTNTAGFIYSTITASAFTSVTTVTVVNDLGVLDSGLSAVAYGIISVDDTSDPFHGSEALSSSMVNAKGDIVTATADNAPAVLTVGANGTYLSADSTQSTGLIWRELGGAINTQTGATYTVVTSDTSIIANGSATMTLTLLAAATYPGRVLRVRTIAAFTVVSATANVVPLAGGAAGTAILAATAGKWADLQSDGVNWQIMASN